MKTIELRGPCDTIVCIIKRGVDEFSAHIGLRKNGYHMFAHASGNRLRFCVHEDDSFVVWIDCAAFDLVSIAEAERGAAAFGLTVERDETTGVDK